MNPLAANLIRTYVPVLVGAVASWLTARGIGVTPGISAGAVVAMTAVFTGAYYTIARVLEEKFPAAGRVLLLSGPAAAPAGQPDCDLQAEDDADWLSALHGDDHAFPRPAAATGPNPLAQLVAQPAPREILRVRKADTGAIPAYRRPAGR
jgi:hypothetical protein